MLSIKNVACNIHYNRIDIIYVAYSIPVHKVDLTWYKHA